VLLSGVLLLVQRADGRRDVRVVLERGRHRAARTDQPGGQEDAGDGAGEGGGAFPANPPAKGFPKGGAPPANPPIKGKAAAKGAAGVWGKGGGPAGSVELKSQKVTLTVTAK